MLCHLKKLSIKQGLKTQYFVILKKYTERITMDHSPIRQTFKFENNFSTVGKSFLNLVKLRSLVVKYCKMWKI